MQLLKLFPDFMCLIYDSLQDLWGGNVLHITVHTEINEVALNEGHNTSL